ncbi:MAG: HD domain-containing protein [Clostridia bacterium]|nr:HD domain-containing protein [Clostridia bacterium]
MINELPEKLISLALALEKPLYAVGGACRDFLAGLTPQGKRDWDICSPESAGEVAAAAEKLGFSVTAVYKNTGTVRLTCENESYEFTTFRTDKYVRGVHSPAEVFFTEDIMLDARRRDFKCNAVYYDIRARKFVDPLGGIAEIESRVMSTVADSNKVFGEDGLRLMRLCRIAAQTGFTPTEDCIKGAAANCNLIDDIAAERVWEELNAILHADIKYGVAQAQYEGLQLLKRIGVLARVMPELALGDGMEQRKDFHAHDVLEHTLRCVKYAPPEIRLAALLHDVGKPYCKLTYGKFARHEDEGARIAEEICKRLRVSARQTALTCTLVKLHMYDLSGETSENKVRKFIVAHLGVLDKLLLLKQADFSACKDDLSQAPCVIKWKKIYDKMVKGGVPLTRKMLAVRGDDLIAAGISPVQTAKTLDFLLGECAIGNVRNQKEALIRFALARRIQG